MAKTKMGRPTLFQKDGPDIHGRISNEAAKTFEVQRKRLAAFYLEVKGEPWPVKVSDGDVVEFLLRGIISTRLAWKGAI